MNHEEFLKVRDGLRETRPELLDLSELNVYRSLAFPRILPSTHAEAPYRCHLAERFLEFLALPASNKPNTQVSHGVRRSLRALFGLFASRGARVGVPGDVYPVYLSLAAEAGLQVFPYASRLGLPALDELAVVLVCEPLKPWGTSLTHDEAERLEVWAQADPRRLVVIDSAYAMPPTAMARRLLSAEVAALLVSLSKGWLIPDHGGICLVPPRFRADAREAFANLPKDETKLRIAYAALTEHRGRVGEVAAVLAERASRLDSLTSARPELQASRCVGYFAISPRSFEELLGLGVLAAPASVFGGPLDKSVLSAL